MLQFNRAINRGYGSKIYESEGFKAVLAATEGLRAATTCNTNYTMEQSKHKSDLLQRALVNTDIVPMRGKLSVFTPATVELISGSDWEPLWDQLVRRHHYLGYQRLLGHRLKYFAFLQDRPVAALSWSAAALKLAARDCFIGWSPAQRKRHLHQVISNSRFLIMPWVQIPNLASHVMALNIARLTTDWQKNFNQQLLLLETFVDSRYFTGGMLQGFELAAHWTYPRQYEARQGIPPSRMPKGDLSLCIRT